MCIQGVLTDVWSYDTYVFERWIHVREWLDAKGLRKDAPVRRKAFVSDSGEVYLCAFNAPTKFTKP